MNPEARFSASLARTQQWCEARINLEDPEHSLRSGVLQPTLGEHDGTVRGLWLRKEHIEEVVRKRDQLLVSASERLRAVDGRLLAVAYEYTNHNDASADETNYFFDENDVPPWDTWVDEVEGQPTERMGEWGTAWPPTLTSHMGGALNRGVLIAWIPAAFVPLAQKGIDTECVGMLSWADEPSRGSPRFESVLPSWLLRLAAEFHRE